MAEQPELPLNDPRIAAEEKRMRDEAASRFKEQMNLYSSITSAFARHAKAGDKSFMDVTKSLGNLYIGLSENGKDIDKVLKDISDNFDKANKSFKKFDLEKELNKQLKDAQINAKGINIASDDAQVALKALATNLIGVSAQLKAEVALNKVKFNRLPGMARLIQQNEGKLLETEKTSDAYTSLKEKIDDQKESYTQLIKEQSLYEHLEGKAKQEEISRLDDLADSVIQLMDSTNVTKQAMETLAKTGNSIAKGMEAALVYMITRLVAVTDTYKQTSQSSFAQSYSDVTQKQGIGTYISGLAKGIEFSKMAEQAGTLTDFLGTSDKYSKSLLDKTATMARYFGLSSEEAASLTGNLKNSLGGSESLTNDVLSIGEGLAYANKVPVGRVLREASKSGGQLAASTAETAKNFLKATVLSAKMGLNMSDVVSSTHSLLDFEGAIDKQVTASIMLGKQIDLTSIQRARNARDFGGVLSEIKRQLDGIDFGSMSQLQIDALQNAMGLSIEQMQKIKSTKIEDFKTMDESKLKQLTESKAGEERMGSIVSEFKETTTKLLGKIVHFAEAIWIAMEAGLLAGGAGRFAEKIGLPTGIIGSGVGFMGGAKAIGRGMGMGGSLAAGMLASGATSGLTGFSGGGLLGGSIGSLLGSAAAFTPAAPFAPLISAGLGALGTYIGNKISESGTNTNPETVDSVLNETSKSSESSANNSKDLADSLREVSSALRNIPSSIIVQGDFQIDSRKFGTFVQQAIDTNKKFNRGTLNSSPAKI